MSNCQKGEEEKDHSNNRKRKADDRPPSSLSSSSFQSSAVSCKGDDQCEVFLFQRHPIMWSGTLHMKNEDVSVQMHLVSGYTCLARKVLPEMVGGEAAPLKITQRLKLEQQELQGVRQKLLLEDEHCILVALPCGVDRMDSIVNSHRMKNHFISYFEKKQAAGIVNVALPNEPNHVIHMFPVCDFTNEQLSVLAPCLLRLLDDLPYLVVIITTLITTAVERPNPVDSDTPAPSA